MFVNFKEICELMFIDCLINIEKIVYVVYYIILLFGFKYVNI